MSHEIAKSISIKKNGVITMNAACNNVYPRIYQTVAHYDLSKKYLFKYLIGRLIQPHKSANEYIWSYCILVTKQAMERDKISSLDFYALNEDHPTFLKYYTLFWTTHENCKSTTAKKYIVFHKQGNGYLRGSNKKNYYITNHRPNALTYAMPHALYLALSEPNIFDAIPI